MHQVFLNLITNALEAMPNGAMLRLTMRDDFDWIAQRRGFSVYVTDTGISRRDAKRLFEPFSPQNPSRALVLGSGSAEVSC
jgi:signal transduction histidine kinase